MHRASLLGAALVLAVAATSSSAKPISELSQLPNVRVDAAVSTCSKFGDALQQCNSQSTTPTALITCSCTSDTSDLQACPNDSSATADQKTPAYIYMAACTAYRNGNLVAAANCLLTANPNSAECQAAKATGGGATNSSSSTVRSSTTSAATSTTGLSTTILPTITTSSSIGSRPLLSSTTTSSSAAASASNAAPATGSSNGALLLLSAAVGAIFVA